MLRSAKPAVVPPTNVQLPRTSTRLQKPQVYVKIVNGMKQENWGAVTYEGSLHAPGDVVPWASLPQPAVLIECAGPIGVWQRGKHREVLYILWRWDWIQMDWVEVARAQSLNWSWTVVLKEAVYQALHPRPDLVDIIQRSRDLAEEMLRIMHERLEPEMPDVQKTAWHSIYERVAGRIAGA